MIITTHLPDFDHARVYRHLRRYSMIITIYDRFEQKQADGCVLTNPLNAAPLRPDSTFIDGFSWAIHQKIADFNSYPLRYQFWKSVYKCWAFSGFVKTHPSACFCSKRSHVLQTNRQTEIVGYRFKDRNIGLKLYFSFLPSYLDQNVWIRGMNCRNRSIGTKYYTVAVYKVDRLGVSLAQSSFVVSLIFR